MRPIPLFVLFLLSACASFDSAETRQIRASINLSEWASANWLKLDLETGEYSIKPGYHAYGYAVGKRRIEPQSGALTPDDLDQLNRMVETALAAGLQDTECLAKPKNARGVLVISNAGPHEIKIRANGLTVSARDELECWTEEGDALYKFLHDLFEFSHGLPPFDPRLKEL